MRWCLWYMKVNIICGAFLTMRFRMRGGGHWWSVFSERERESNDGRTRDECAVKLVCYFVSFGSLCVGENCVRSGCFGRVGEVGIKGYSFGFQLCRLMFINVRISCMNMSVSMSDWTILACFMMVFLWKLQSLIDLMVEESLVSSSCLRFPIALSKWSWKIIRSFLISMILLVDGTF